MDIKPDISALRKVPLKIVNIGNEGNQTMKTVYLTSVGVSSSESSPQPRKRQRLDHLSVEEKLMRRKLKNRVAAQSARDRKKYHMQDLEDHVKNLAEQNDRLAEENQKLQLQISNLLQENILLKKCGDMDIPSPVVNVKVEALPVESEVAVALPPPCEPAAFTTTSQQQRWADTVRLLLVCNWIGTCLGSALWMLPYLTWTTSVLLLTGSKYSEKSLNPKEVEMIIQKLGHPSKWWGSQQHGWNPSKNLFKMITSTPGKTAVMSPDSLPF